MFRNNTQVTQFILSGLFSDPILQLPLLLICLSMYLVTLFGNFIIILLIKITPSLHTPMYFFVMNLSIVDIIYSSAITPNTMIKDLYMEKTISLYGCATQMFLFIALASSEAMLLAIMAYDRYVAICRPLYYSSVVTKQLCLQLVLSVYSAGSINSLIHTCGLFRLPFCHSNIINHFFCDFHPVLKLACADTLSNEVCAFVIAGSIEVGSFLCIMTSYLFILRAISMSGSSSHRLKPLSTCASHFLCVAIFYIPVFFTYLRPKSAHYLEQDWVVSVFYTMIIPMLNPIIYSLRNQDVKQALTRLSFTNIFILFRFI